MTPHFRSTTNKPYERGREFGATHAAKIKTGLSAYGKMWVKSAGGTFDPAPLGREALVKVAAYAPDLHAEMQGLADGSGIDVALIGALNARTEILGFLKAKQRGECSAVIHVSPDAEPPIAVQTWDWFYAFRDGWLIWEIPLADGSVTKTMTEYGIVGKSGLNTRGIGALFTILHHTDDGGRIGLPVHVAARHALDHGADINQAATLLAGADVSASSSINLVSVEDGVNSAISVELHPGGPSFVLPDDAGFIVHTNHFLAPGPAAHDTEPKAFPDTLLRRDLLRRQLGNLQPRYPEDVLSVMTSHVGKGASVCCHHDPALGDPDAQYQTLATVVLDLARGDLRIHAGGPCTHPAIA